MIGISAIKRRYNPDVWFIVWNPLRCPGHPGAYHRTMYMWKTDLKFHGSTNDGNRPADQMKHWAGYYSSPEEAEEYIRLHNGRYPDEVPYVEV